MKKMINIEGDSLTANVESALTAVAAADLEGKLRVAADDEKIKNMYIDLKNVQYVSSAGLRVFLSMHRLMKERDGRLVLKNVNEEVAGIIRLTGFEKIFEVE